MKKSYILLAALFIGGTSFLGAQNKTTRWYNYADTKNLENGGLGVLNGDFLFPDTNIVAKYSNGNTPPFFHSIANVLDVTAPAFNDAAYYPGEVALDSGKTFTVDSMSVLLRYNRINNVDDTLYVEVAVENLYFVPASSTVMLPAAEVLQDITYKRVYYNDKTNAVAGNRNTLNHAGKKVYQIVLKGDAFTLYGDSAANGLQTVKFATPGLPVATAGIHQVVSAIKFVPGYTYDRATDTLNYKNNIQFIATEENGNNTFMNYTTNDFNISYFADTYLWYNYNTGFYQNFAQSGGPQYIPSFGYPYITEKTDAKWRFENLVWGYHVNCSNCTGVSTNDLSGNDFTNGIKLGQNVPNPANGLSVINYELIGSSMVSLSVYDITGKRVLSLEEGKKTAGKHSVVIDTHQLQSGVYFYTLSSDAGASLTRKMIITE